MQEVKLRAAKRGLEKTSAKATRNSGMVPGIVYGQGKEATPIQVEAGELVKAFAAAGTSKILDLQVEGAKDQSVLFHDIQYDHLGKNIIHFDLYTVKMDEKIRTEVPIHFVGESPVVYEQNATLLKNIEGIEVEALPKDLPESIEVDISGLTEMEQSIHISDLKLPEGVTIFVEPEEMIVKTEAPREEEEEEEIPEDAEAAVAAEHGGESPAESEEGGDTEEASEEPKGGNNE